MGSGALTAIGLPYLLVIPMAAIAGNLGGTGKSQALFSVGGFSIGAMSASIITLVAAFIIIFVIAIAMGFNAATVGFQAGTGKLIMVVGGGLVMWMIVSFLALNTMLAWPTWGAVTYGFLTLVEMLGILLESSGTGV
jgi:hypothetical protein